MTVKAEFRVAVGRPYEYISLFIEGDYVADVAGQIDGMNDESVLKLGEFHRNLGGALQTAWDMGHEAALKLLTDGLGATVEEVIKTSDTLSESEAEDMKKSRPWERKMEAKPKAWEPAKIAELDDF